MRDGPMENAQLYQAVLADPDSDTPRERYAAWLAANGEGERAELIRLQLEIARTPTPASPDEPNEEWERRMARVFALLRDHPEWRDFPALPGVSWTHGVHFGFARGFQNSVMVTGSEAFTMQMGQVFEKAPVTRVVVEKVKSTPECARQRPSSPASG